MRIAINAALFMAATVFGIVSLEAGLRVYDWASGYEPAGATQTVRPFRMFGIDHYRDGMIVSRHDETYPLEKPQGMYRIVVFGGSTTENMSAFRASGTHYPGELQKELRKTNPNVEVISVGYSAYATPHTLILLSLDVISWQPDLIVVSHNINDLLVSYWPNFVPDYANKYSHPFYTKAPSLLSRSRLWLRINWRLPKTFPAIQRKPYGPIPIGLETFKRNLRSIISVAKTNGIEVILGTQPLMEAEEFFLRHMRAKPYNDVIVYPTHPEFVRHHRLFNDTILDVAKSEGVHGVENRGVLQPEDFIDFVHYAPSGVRKLAKNYAAAIVNLMR